MSFIDGFTAPKEGSTLPKIGGGFLDDFNLPTESSLRSYNLNIESDKLKQEAIKANKIGTILKEAGKDLVKKTTKFYKSENEFTWDSYKESPDLLLSDINKDVEILSKPNYQNVRPDDMALKPGQFNNQPLIGSETKPIQKPNKEQLTANALLKPLSISLGVMLEKGEIKNLSDNEGNILVDKNGITDMDNFLRFVSQNNEFMEKFINLVNEVSNPKIGKENNKDLPKLLEDLSSSIFNKTIPTNSRQKITPERYLEMVNTWGNDVINSWINVGTQSKEAYKSFKEPNTGTKRFVESAKVGLSALGAFFTPVSSVFLQAETTPGIVGDTAKFANKFFEIVGKVGAEGAGKAIDLYSPFSNKTNDEIKPISMEIGNLVSQILVGRGGELAYKKLGLKTNEFINKISEEARLKQVNQTIPKETLSKWVEQSKEAEDLRNKALPTKEERYQDYLKSQGYEPYIPNDKLPVIDMGKPAKDSLPTIQVGESLKITKNQKGEYTYEPIKEGGETTKAKVEETPIPKEESTFTTTPKPEVNPNVKVSKQAEDIARSLDEEFDIKVSDEDLATYKTKEGFMQDQAQKANSLIESDPQLGMDIAMGIKNAPKGLNSESVYATMKRVAMDAGDTQTLINLSKSKVASKASVKGQEIKSLDLYDHKMTDPVKILQDINKSYETAFEKKSKVNYTTAKENVVKEIKMSIKKNAPTKKSWEDFINQVKCNY